MAKPEEGLIRSILRPIGDFVQDNLRINSFEPFEVLFGESVIGVSIIAIIVVSMLITAVVQSTDFFTPANTRSHTLRYVGEWEKTYSSLAPSRKSLHEYLRVLSEKQQIEPQQKCLANFLIMTANGAGMFLPGEGGKFAIANVDSVSYLLRAGVRGFIFDVRERLDDIGKPFIFMSDADPTRGWRTTSMNWLPLRDPMNRLRIEAFGDGTKSKGEITKLRNTADPIFVYLRFSRIHRKEFYNEVANVLENAFRDYKLDYTWAATRREADFYTTDIQEFMGRVVILSNQRAGGTRLEDFINIVAPSSVKDYYKAQDISNMSQGETTKEKALIQQHVLAAFDPLGTPESLENAMQWDRAHQLGIQMVALNFFNKKGNLEGYRNLFGNYSFKLKPAHLRHNVRVTEKPKKPGQDANAKGGNVSMPGLNMRT